MARNMGEINVNNNKVARHLLKGGQETHFCFVCGFSIMHVYTNGKERISR